MRVLGIDSSANSASVCVLEDDKILTEFFINNKLTHSQTLMPMIESSLKNSMVDLESIDFFAVATGPGSFTGVRIGVSTIKGMALALNKPCVSVSTLESMAYNLIDFDCIACAVMDARCNQVYNAIFEIKNKNITKIKSDRAIKIDELMEELKSYKKKIFFVGDGAILCYNNSGCLHSSNLPSEVLMYQRASSVAKVGMKYYKLGQVLDSSSLVPVYLRPSQAERELKKRGEIL